MFSIQLFYHQEELQENDTLRKGTHLMKKYFKLNKLELYFRFENLRNNKYFILKHFKNFLLCRDKMLVV